MEGPGGVWQGRRQERLPSHGTGQEWQVPFRLFPPSGTPQVIIGQRFLSTDPRRWTVCGTPAPHKSGTIVSHIPRLTRSSPPPAPASNWGRPSHAPAGPWPWLAPLQSSRAPTRRRSREGGAPPDRRKGDGPRPPGPPAPGDPGSERGDLHPPFRPRSAPDRRRRFRGGWPGSGGEGLRCRTRALDPTATPAVGDQVRGRRSATPTRDGSSAGTEG